MEVALRLKYVGQWPCIIGVFLDTVDMIAIPFGRTAMSSAPWSEADKNSIRIGLEFSYGKRRRRNGSAVNQRTINTQISKAGVKFWFNLSESFYIDWLIDYVIYMTNHSINQSIDRSVPPCIFTTQSINQSINRRVCWPINKPRINEEGPILKPLEIRVAHHRT